MTCRFAFPMVALLVAGGCSGRDASGPAAKDTRLSASAVSSSRNAGGANDGATFPRSGALHATKNCSQYTGLPGSFCTITSSNIPEIEPGTRVVYASGLAGGSLNSAIVLDPPGPGNNTAFGHVVLDLASAQGVVTISGGTGRFTWLNASVVVSHLSGRDWAWDGTYSFSPRD